MKYLILAMGVIGLLAFIALPFLFTFKQAVCIWILLAAVHIRIDYVIERLKWPTGRKIGL